MLSHKTTHVTHPKTALQRALLKRQDITGKTHALQDLGLGDLGGKTLGMYGGQLEFDPWDLGEDRG